MERARSCLAQHRFTSCPGRAPSRSGGSAVGLILLLARVLLSVVFVVAGLAKLDDRAGARRALRDFGVPAALATPLRSLLPLAELTVAVALLPTRSAWWGALAPSCSCSSS